MMEAELKFIQIFSDAEGFYGLARDGQIYVYNYTQGKKERGWEPFDMGRYPQAAIKEELPFDFCRFRVGKTILRDSHSMEWLFLGRAEDEMLVRKYGNQEDGIHLVYAGKPSAHDQLTVVSY